MRQLLRNGQITLPRKAVEFFHLKERDLLDVRYDRKGIHLVPLSVEELSDDEYAKLAKKLRSLRREKGKVYSTTRGARRHLERLMNER